jgi:hypothetical protein
MTCVIYVKHKMKVPEFNKYHYTLAAGLIFILIALLCTTTDIVTNPFYQPPVTFSGIFAKSVGGDSVYLPGNMAFPNTCQLVDDTVRMYFYSPDFSHVNQIWSGYLLRLDIYPLRPDSTDSGFIEPNIVSLHDVLCKLSAYAVPQNTYRVSRPDTLYPTFSVQMKIEALERRRNGRIILHNIYAGLHQEGNYSLALEIKRGEISGRIQ